jgi:hypothetical protein
MKNLVPSIHSKINEQNQKSYFTVDLGKKEKKKFYRIIIYNLKWVRLYTRYNVIEDIGYISDIRTMS